MLQRVVYIFTFWRHLNLGPTYLWQACQERPEPSRLAASYPPHSRGGPRSETQSSSLPKPFCSSCTLPWLVHASTTFGHRTSQGLCTSALPRGRFLLPSSEPGSKCTTSREWLPGPAPAWTPQGSDPGVEPSCQSCYIFVLFHCSSLPTPPPFPDWFYKSKLLRWPRKWGGGARKMTSWGRWGWVRSWGFFFVFLFCQKSLGTVVWIIWCPPEWDPEVCMSCVEGSLDLPQPPPSPSAMLMAEAEKIRTYSPFLTGEENLSSGFAEKVPPYAHSTLSLPCARISHLKGQKKCKILEWACIITLILLRVSAFQAEVIHSLF